MSVRLGLDGIRVGGKERDLAMPIAASAGEVVEIRGWAVDGDTGRAVRSVAARLDKRQTFHAEAGVARPDLVAKLGEGARNSGFVLEIPTAALRPATHRVFFVMTTDGGVDWTSLDIQLQIRAGDGRPPYYPQILIAAAMKSGSRHVTSVLRRYFGIENPMWSDANDGEHLLTEDLMQPVSEQPFVAGFHCLGRAINLNAIAHWGLRTAVTWRNLGDVVVSLDDHLCNAPEGIWRSWPFMDERESYRGLPAQDRYRFVIRNSIPWYLGFYLSWRLARQPLMMRYEWMASDPRAYFRYLLERLDGRVDEQRLFAVVDAGPSAESGFNVGVAGRSDGALGEENQELLETTIREHPSDVGELLFELPWYAAKHAPPQLVTADGVTYLVAERAKRRANEHWLRTHQIDPAAIATAATADLAGLRPAADLF